MLSTKSFVTTQILILGLCGLGWLFGIYSLFWPGIAMFAAAFTVFVVMSQRDRDLPRTEDLQVGWEKLRAKGIFRYLFKQLSLVAFSFVPLFLFDRIGAYQSGSKWSPVRWLPLLGLLLFSTILISLCWWYVQKRRYRSVS